MKYVPSYYSKQNPIGPLNAERVAEEVLIFVFTTAFPVSHKSKRTSMPWLEPLESIVRLRLRKICFALKES